MKQSLDVSGLWVGNILVNGKWEGFKHEDDLETLTAHIKQQTRGGDMLDFIDGPIPFPDEDAREPETPWNEYGLMETR